MLDEKITIFCSHAKFTTHFICYIRYVQRSCSGYGAGIVQFTLICLPIGNKLVGGFCFTTFYNNHAFFRLKQITPGVLHKYTFCVEYVKIVRSLDNIIKNTVMAHSCRRILRHGLQHWNGIGIKLK